MEFKLILIFVIATLIEKLVLVGGVDRNKNRLPQNRGINDYNDSDDSGDTLWDDDLPSQPGLTTTSLKNVPNKKQNVDQSTNVGKSEKFIDVNGQKILKSTSLKKSATKKQIDTLADVEDELQSQVSSPRRSNRIQERRLKKQADEFSAELSPPRRPRKKQVPLEEEKEENEFQNQPSSSRKSGRKQAQISGHETDELTNQVSPLRRSSRIQASMLGEKADELPKTRRTSRKDGSSVTTAKKSSSTENNISLTQSINSSNQSSVSSNVSFPDLPSFIQYLANIHPKTVNKIQKQLTKLIKENPFLQPLLGGLQGLLQNQQALKILSSKDTTQVESYLQAPLKIGSGIIEPIINFVEQLLGISLKKTGSTVKGAGEIADAAFENAKDILDNIRSNSPFKIIPGLGVITSAAQPLSGIFGRFLDTGHELIGGTAESVGTELNEVGKQKQRRAEARRTRTRY